MLPTRRPEPRTEDWRALASAEDLREYDRFGPWIDEVTTEALMPPRFRAFYDELSSARLLLKVPRAVERRVARPGQDLYAAVLALHDDHLTLLRLPDRTEDPVPRRDVALRDVVALSTLTNLLVGRWTVLLRDGSRLALDHSTVSKDRMEAATDLLRARMATPPGDGTVPPVTVDVDDIAFRTALLTVGRRSGAPPTPVHVEPRNALRRDTSGHLVLTSGLLVADAGQELVVVDGGPARQPWRGRTYAWTTTFLRYDRLSSFSVVPPRQRGQVHELVLTAGRQDLSVPCTQAPDAVVTLLTAQGVTHAPTRAA